MDKFSSVMQYLDKNQDALVGFLKELVDRPSINTFFADEAHKNDEAYHEENCQKYVASYLEKMGFQIDMWEPDADALSSYKDKPGYYAGRSFRSRPNVAATRRGTGGGKSILLLGHIDVVDPGNKWTVDPFHAVVKDGYVYGRGSVDMKGGIASMIMAVKAILDSGIKLKGDVLVGTVADEEAGGMGTLALIDRGYRAAGCILTEPTNLTVAPLCRGILWGKLKIQGRSGHIELDPGDWRSGGAVDAIDKAMLYMQHFSRINKEWATTRRHPLLPIPCQFNVAQFNAGEYPTAFANSAEIVFDTQYLPSERDSNSLGGKMKKWIEDYVYKIAQTDEWLSEHVPTIEWLVDADCAETSMEEPFVQTLCHSFQTVGEQVVVEGNTSHTDMGWPVNVGIPTVNFGPGDSRFAHQNDEHTPVSQLLSAAKIIAGTILDWCGTEE